MGSSSPGNVVPGDILVVDQPSDQNLIPYHSCGGQQHFVYKALFFLVNQSTSEEYLIYNYTQDIFGENCASTQSQYWDVPPSLSITVPCYIPTGSYWFRVVLNLVIYTN